MSDIMHRGESRHAYDRKALYGDYWRSGTGILLTLGPLLATGAGGAAAVVLGGLAGIFALFGLRTAARQRTLVAVGPDGVSTESIRRVTVRWTDMRRVKLSYFSTRRDRQKGWMQLMLRGSGPTIRIDSQLDDFEGLLARVAEATVEYGITVSDASAANFAAFGHVVQISGRAGDENPAPPTNGPTAGTSS